MTKLLGLRFIIDARAIIIEATMDILSARAEAGYVEASDFNGVKIFKIPKSRVVGVS